MFVPILDTFGSQVLAYRPDVVGKPGRLAADWPRCPIGWDVFGDEPARGQARPAGMPGLAAGHAGDVRGLGHLDR
ncbi:hypothetical protein [Actinomyces qiguomingii]|uniref:hypothetical protein n=1 Tax=Actinomyces qiguomingii TaxID=2057800 RepID=UPI000CA03269|nr:hypothetical protein [Actinomyces qiguomingii]